MNSSLFFKSQVEKDIHIYSYCIYVLYIKCITVSTSCMTTQVYTFYKITETSRDRKFYRTRTMEDCVQKFVTPKTTVSCKYLENLYIFIETKFPADLWSEVKNSVLNTISSSKCGCSIRTYFIDSFRPTHHYLFRVLVLRLLIYTF